MLDRLSPEVFLVEMPMMFGSGSSADQRRHARWAAVGVLLAVIATGFGIVLPNIALAQQKSAKGAELGAGGVDLTVAYPPGDCRKRSTGCDSEICKQLLNDCLNAPRFKIPKSYLHVRGNQDGGIQPDVYLRAVYPGMRGVGGAPSSRAKEEDAVRITLRVRGAESLSGMFARYVEIWRVAKQSRQVDGMDHYRTVNPDAIQYDFYIPSGEDVLIFYQCVSPRFRSDGNPISVGCSAHSRFKGIDVEYSFPRMRFSERAMLHEKVIGLLETFLVKQ
jgi:hypothetical protein